MAAPKPTHPQNHPQGNGWHMLTWDAVSGVDDHGYESEYEWGGGRQNEPRSVLFPCSTGATAWCRIRNHVNGTPSDWVTVTINSSGEIIDPDPEQPPKPPSGLHLVSTNIQEGTATVGWDEPTDAEYWEILLENHWSQWQRADRVRYTFYDLYLGSEYGYRVRAVRTTSSGATLRSAPTRDQFTFDDVPPPERTPAPPENLRVIDVQATSASATWDTPASTPVEIDYYWINYVPAGGEGTSDTTVTTRYPMQRLSPSTRYRVQVRSHGVNGAWSDPVVDSFTTREKTDPPPPPPGGWPTSAPFVDATHWPTPRLRKWFHQWGVGGFFLGFWTAKEKSGGYHLTWGGYDSAFDKYEPLPDDEFTGTDGRTHSSLATNSQYLQWLTRDIQSEGGVIIPSVGGAAGHPLEQHPEVDLDDAANEYVEALDNYNTTYLDFDIEGSALTSEDQRRRHVTVLTKIRSRRPDIQISHTFAVDIDGYNHHTQSLVAEMTRQGYVPDIVMGMLMEMRVAEDGSYYTSLKRTAEAMVAANSAAFGWSTEESWHRAGLCPMFGANNGVANDARKVTTVKHMRRVISEIARPHEVAVVSGWSANRDYHTANPHQKQEQTPSCPPGPPYPSIYSCTHVEQEHSEFSKIAATYVPAGRA
ncbi:hypothetical protein IL38_24115 [Actinopolyspora erythraea]|uniref:Fibronectin type-III domain-containing protein n=1 Tax=Actinopolyspora erythraea TaxID=414996 RepID=A0ABR4WYC6_9ACTN|nr:fibronectin type III domain-containing protein [Actinopolyspora erythraea]KGI79384.1 hypothetical protein IL38_24115 [Actinopolyspora erythraea]